MGDTPKPPAGEILHLFQPIYPPSLVGLLKLGDAPSNPPMADFTPRLLNDRDMPGLLVRVGMMMGKKTQSERYYGSSHRSYNVKPSPYRHAYSGHCPDGGCRG